MRDETPLAKLLKTRIQKEGPLTFHDFMQAALFDPLHGFYSKGPSLGTSQGTFNTNAMFPGFAFGLAAAIEQSEVLLGEPLRVVELGGGTGQLATSILSFLGEAHEYVIVEASEGFRVQQEALGLKSIASATELGPSPSFMFGNELLDAMPVHRVMGGSQGELLELYVGLDPNNGFIEQCERPSTTALAERLVVEGVTLGRGQVAEINLCLEEFVKELVPALSKGYLLFIDYGDDADRLYHFSRRNGSLRSYRQQSMVYDPFDAPGDQDLTADVDYTAVRSTVTKYGLTYVGRLSQGSWLLNVGMDGYTSKTGGIDTIENEIRMLTHPARLGTTFDVLAFKVPGLPNPPGFDLKKV